MVRALFSVTVTGFELACRARGLSQHTIDDYFRTYKKFGSFLKGDPDLKEISVRDVTLFLAQQPVSKKSKLNYHIALSALWTWAISEGFVLDHIVRQVKRPRAEIRQVDPFSDLEIRSILAALNRPYTRTDYKHRMRAVVMLLLDTGLRASEICGLTVDQVDVRSGKLIVMGKGDKERRVEFGPRTSQALWKWIQFSGGRGGHPLFTSKTGRRIDRDALAHRIRELGIKAGVLNCHPHRFRHTFAVMFLRNGGNVYALQALLGHSSMDTVRRYVKLAQVDLEQAHRRASPVENLRL